MNTTAHAVWLAALAACEPFASIPAESCEDSEFNLGQATAAQQIKAAISVINPDAPESVGVQDE